MSLLGKHDPLADAGELVPRVYAYVAYRIGHGPDAEDVTGETFVRAVRYRDSYDPGKGSAVGWLIGIASRCISDAVKAADPGLAIDSEPADGLADRIVERVTVQAAVARMDERDRELIALRYGADLTARQIGARLELKTNAVEVALHRALNRLRDDLQAAPQ